MKKILFILSIIAYVFVSSCAEIQFGDAGLSNVPEQDGATLDSMFNSTYNADRVLAAAYSYLPYGVPTADDTKMSYNSVEAITDIMHAYAGAGLTGPSLYYDGTLSSSSGGGAENYRFASENSYYAIRYAYYYIENAYKIPDIDETTRSQRVAEAKVVVAMTYADMLRYVGGVPLIDHVVSTTEPQEFPRATFEETVNFIVDLLDEAAADLPWKNTDESVDGGRLTKASAKGLKLRVLLFAASPTFNSNTLWHADADEYTCYTNYSEDRWKDAYDAGYDLFQSSDNILKYYSLVTASGTSPSHADYCAAYREAYYVPGSSESLISIRKSTSYSYHSYMYASSLFSGVTLNYVNMFDWADGTPFDADNFDWNVDWTSTEDYTFPFYTLNTTDDAVGDPTRDPRLYESVAVPGSMYQTNVTVPTYTNALTNYQAFDNNPGFYMFKFVLDSTTAREANYPHWPALRLAELYLSYAEILNEYKNDQTSAVAYVNNVRDRVGLCSAPDGMSQSEMRDYILDERAKEFALEEVRWFDLVRHGKEDVFKKTLQRLTSVGYSLDDSGASVLDGVSPTHYSYEVVNLQSVRSWVTSFDTRWYLAPIPLSEVNLDYGMTQNPGW